MSDENERVGSDTEVCPPDRHLTYLEACQELGISRSTLDRWRKTRPGFPQPFRLVRRELLFSEAELVEWMFKTVRRSGGVHPTPLEGIDEDEG